MPRILVLSFIGAVGLGACGKKTSKNLTSVLGSSASCHTAILDQGQKGSVATVVRGAYSDTKVMPGTMWSATAFADASALSIKLAYWNGSSFETEAIAGDGNGGFLRLAFLSTGIPIVTWTTGVNLKAAIRSAPLGQPGSWGAGIIDVATAPRAVELAINPLDQITVTYLTDTATTGRPRFLYCDAPCTSTAGFQTMGTNPYIENTALVAAQVATGAGWCRAASNTYYPVATYAVTGGVRYAVCMNSLVNCLNGANWTGTTVAAATAVASKLILDNTVTGDVPKVVTNGAAGLIPYRMGTTACSSVPAAFSAGTAIGTASSGSLWISGAKDATGRFHLVANEATSSVRYYNTTGTDFIGGWNGAGIVDTVTLPAASAGGAALNSATGGLLTSYGMNAVPYDIKFGYVNDYGQASSGATFTRSAADLTGDLQLAATGTQIKQVAAGSTPAGRPAVAYVDFSVGSVNGAKLKFAARTGDSSASPWDITLIPDTINPQFPSLRYDANGLPWISYFDASALRYYLTTNSRSDGSGGWYTYEFPAVPSGPPVALPAANNTALGTFVNNGRTDMIMATIDTNATSKGVRVSVFNTLNRSFSAPILVDGLTAGAAGAAHVSVDGDGKSLMAIAYQELNLGRVRYATSSNGGGTWTNPVNISGISQGAGAQLKVNRDDGTPGISYFDQSNNSVYYVHCAGNLTACATGGWTPTTLEGAAGVSGLAATSSQLLTTSLHYTDGVPYVLYPRGQGNDGNLLFGFITAGSFITSLGGRGTNGSLPGTNALNFGVAGWGIAAAKNAAGGITGAYLGPGNWLYSISCGD